MAENGEKERYYKPSREVAKRELHRLILSEGLTGAQLSDRLKIPRRSVERYLSEIYREDSELLLNPTRETIARQLALFSDKLTRHYEIAISIAKDSSVDGKARTEALEMANVIGYAQANLYKQVPAVVQRRLPAATVRRLEQLPTLVVTAPPTTEPTTTTV